MVFAMPADVDEETQKHLDHYFQTDTVFSAMTTEFATVPDSDKTWLDRIRDAAVNAEEGYTWLRDPYSWSRGWRRVVMLTFPIAFIVWLGVLLILFATGLGLDLVYRLSLWVEMNFTSFDDWWNRDEASSTAAYVIDIESGGLDSQSILSAERKK